MPTAADLVTEALWVRRMMSRVTEYAQSLLQVPLSKAFGGPPLSSVDEARDAAAQQLWRAAEELRRVALAFEHTVDIHEALLQQRRERMTDWLDRLGGA